jgi:putative Holliday junction resolvase
MPSPLTSTAPTTRARSILAFDFGKRRIGIAVGDTVTRSAAPRPAALVHASGPDWDAIAREVRAALPEVLLVGLPLHADGTPGMLSPQAREFGAALAARFALPVEYVDEWGSSLEANAALTSRRASGARTRRVRRADIVSAAAAVILERWLAGERHADTAQEGVAPP